MKKCKDCEYFKNGFCKKETKDLPFLMVGEDTECLFERSHLRCSKCIYWVEVEGVNEEIGGCKFYNGLYPTFLGSPCLINDEDHRRRAEYESYYKCSCKEGRENLKDPDFVCRNCLLQEEIMEAFPKISQDKVYKIMDIVYRNVHNACQVAQQEAVNDMARRM